MKFKIFFIYLSFIPCLFCFLRKASFKTLSKATMTDAQSARSKAYGKIILDELNKYRKLHFFQKKMEWLDELHEQAQSEADAIIRKNTFGDHDKFQKYDNAHVNDYFTEIVIKIQFNDHSLPTKRTFAQYILTSLMTEYKFYIVQDYSNAGIAVLQDLGPNEYIVVLHLLQEARRNTCKKSLDSGEKANSISINIKGVTETLQCDQTTGGGGWTLIADVDEYARGTALIIPIDDRGLEYNQILFEAKKDWYLNYNFGTPNLWDFDGFNFRFNCLQFGDAWYVARSHDGYNVKYEIYDPEQDLEILTPATKCFFGGAQQLVNCAKKFIFKSIPNGRVSAFSELQSAADTDLVNNIYHFNFKLYVR